MKKRKKKEGGLERIQVTKQPLQKWGNCKAKTVYILPFPNPSLAAGSYPFFYVLDDKCDFNIFNLIQIGWQNKIVV